MKSDEILEKLNLKIQNSTDDYISIFNNDKSTNTCIYFCNLNKASCHLECVFYFDEGLIFNEYIEAVREKAKELNLFPANNGQLQLDDIKNESADKIFENYNLKIQEETNELISIYSDNKGISSSVDFVKTRTARHKLANALEFSFYFNENIDFIEFLEAIQKKVNEFGWNQAVV